MSVCTELPVKWVKDLEPETSCMKGQPMYLTCELNKERDVIWKRNGEVLKKKAGKVAINVIGMQHAVTIQNSTEEDAGKYTCEVESQEDVKTTTDVKIIGKHSNIKDSLSITYSIQKSDFHCANQRQMYLFSLVCTKYGSSSNVLV